MLYELYKHLGTVYCRNSKQREGTTSNGEKNTRQCQLKAGQLLNTQQHLHPHQYEMRTYHQKNSMFLVPISAHTNAWPEEQREKA